MNSVATAESSRLADWIELTKPRMNFMVVLTAMVGFCVANGATNIAWATLAFTIVGTAMCAGSAAVLNQLIERDYDALMPRTADRPLAAGRLQPAQALWFGVGLGAAGVGFLAITTTVLAAGTGLATIAIYLLLYTPAKRTTPWNTHIGAVVGALPPVLGVAAATGAVTPLSFALFAILYCWQIPHFYAIAILYRDDYRAGGYQMLPVVDEELRTTGLEIMLFSMSLFPASIAPSLVGAAGGKYATFAVLATTVFMLIAMSAAVRRERRDARRLFFASILYLPLLMIWMVIDAG